MSSQMRYKLPQALFIFLLLLTMMATACSNQSSAPAPAQPDSSKETPNTGGSAQETKNANVQGVTDTTIKIGIWGPQTGPAASYGVLGKGVDSYFKYLNEKGGINGRNLELIFYDDAYQPAKAVAAAKKLLEEDKVYAMVGMTGTASILAAKDYLVQKGIPVVGFASGSSVFTDPVIKTFFAVMPNYALEGRALLRFTAENLGKKKIGVLYQNDDFGKDNLAGIEAYAKEKGIELAAKVPYNPTDVDYSSAALKMKEAGVDAIILCTLNKPAAAFAKEVRKLGMDAQLVANYVTGADVTVMTALAGDAWEGAVVAGFGPKTTDDTPEMKTFREYWKKAYPTENEYSSNALAGWAYAEVLVEGIRRAGDDLSWENLIKQLETFDDFVGDYAQHVTYTPDDHRGIRTIYFMEVKNGENIDISDNISLE